MKNNSDVIFEKYMRDVAIVDGHRILVPAKFKDYKFLAIGYSDI